MYYNTLYVTLSGRSRAWETNGQRRSWSEIHQINHSNADIVAVISTSLARRLLRVRARA